MRRSYEGDGRGASLPHADAGAMSTGGCCLINGVSGIACDPGGTGPLGACLRLELNHHPDREGGQLVRRGQCGVMEKDRLTLPEPSANNSLKPRSVLKASRIVHLTTADSIESGLGVSRLSMCGAECPHAVDRHNGR